MVLADTSIWIRYLANRAPVSDELDRLLEYGEVLGHELVYGELLIGSTGGRNRLMALYRRMRYAETVSHPEVVQFVLLHHLAGRGAGWIDVHLLASAFLTRTQFWTADVRLAEIAERLGVAYSP